jgi:hypothetical protein
MTELLGDKQRRFTMRITEWLAWVYAQGYAVTFGEAYRTPEQAALNAKSGKGIANSLHTQRLAIDLNLFRRNSRDEWEWISDGSAPEWRLVGEHWERMGSDHAWGGRFGDANHLSIAHEGRK